MSIICKKTHQGTGMFTIQFSTAEFSGLAQVTSDWGAFATVSEWDINNGVPFIGGSRMFVCEVVVTQGSIQVSVQIDDTIPRVCQVTVVTWLPG